jgi:hypothetical protein
MRNFLLGLSLAANAILLAELIKERRPDPERPARKHTSKKKRSTRRKRT